MQDDKLIKFLDQIKYTYFSLALTAAGLDKTLKTLDNYLIFIPTEDAVMTFLRKLGLFALTAIPEDVLKAILLRHIFLMNSDNVIGKKYLTALSGELIDISNLNITTPKHSSFGNGVVREIDKVIDDSFVVTEQNKMEGSSKKISSKNNDLFEYLDTTRSYHNFNTALKITGLRDMIANFDKYALLIPMDILFFTYTISQFGVGNSGDNWVSYLQLTPGIFRCLGCKFFEQPPLH